METTITSVCYVNAGVPQRNSVLTTQTEGSANNSSTLVPC